MIRKSVLVLFLAIFVMAGAFAQTDFEIMPKNTITVDIGPTYVGVMLGQLGKLMDEEGTSSSGFGIALQYERELFDRFSVTGRFAYLGVGFGFVEKYREDGNDIESEVDMKFVSFSLEGHARYYPFKKTTFFVDGMLGYAYMSSAFSGEVVVTEKGSGRKVSESISFTATRNFLKFGAKVGWRFDFGKPGGFTFEPSFGYYYGVGLGDTVGKQLLRKVNADGDVKEIEEEFKLLENFVFIGGPRISLSFGWRF